ncbi:MAG: ABC transporter permease [Bacteroidetes bacterium]|nr:MAG: ABC transporter permease [Bacteroidota bacterium]
MIFFKLLRESYVFAIHELMVNKTRTILTLLGLTIGIFTIISVLTVFDSLERSMRKGIESLGSNVVFIQKWPWAMGGNNYPWWKYYQRPEPTMKDLREIQKRSTAAEGAAMFIDVSRTVHYLSNRVEDVNVMAITHDFGKIMPMEIAGGRYFTPIESNSGKSVIILGATIAENLFNTLEPVGRKVKVFNQKLEVIGVLKKEGEDLFGGGSDEQVIIPMNYARTVLDIKNMGTTIVVRAKPYITNQELIDELTGVVRSIHKLKPSADNDFAINETDIITQSFDQLFKIIAIVGWIIGGFSLIVGGFGIANIMFVSVRERTNIIGIQKSLGAKNFFILIQFLFEAIFLSLIGGGVGLLLVLAGSYAGTQILGFEILLTWNKIIIGIATSSVIGLIAGYVPALMASRLDPVEAMRMNA